MRGPTDATDTAYAHGAPNMTLVEVPITDLLDLAAVPKIGRMLDSVLSQGPAHIVIDVTACGYADAAGIALLLDLHRRAWRAGGRLTLRAPSPRLRRLLEVTRVDQVLHVESEPGTGSGSLPESG